MNLEQRFKSELPDAYFLDESNLQALNAYLIEQGWIDTPRRVLSADIAGEGNMNKVLRVRLDNQQSFIIKQARPWVEKYPQVAAPVERADVEGLFFEKTGSNSTISKFSPTLLNRDTHSHILMIEDLGNGVDLMTLFDPHVQIQTGTLDAVLGYLSALHQNFTRQSCDFYIENKAMRALNAEHIFDFPFMANNGLNLDEITPGLAALARQYRQHRALMNQVAALRARYLENGNTLLQGDFYPGSFLQTRSGIKVIDTEFCFFGDAEFDLGVLQAHLLMAEQSSETIASLLTKYKCAENFSETLYQQYTGMEIMRRLLGLAQLPLSLPLEAKKQLLKQACGKLLKGA